MRHTVSVLLLLNGLSSAAHAADPPRSPIPKWMSEAEHIANETVTYSICGWGNVDLLAPFFEWIGGSGIDVGLRNDLRLRFEETKRERIRLEAILALHPANKPERRFTGLFPTDGCQEKRREAIEALSKRRRD